MTPTFFNTLGWIRNGGRNNNIQPKIGTKGEDKRSDGRNRKGHVKIKVIRKNSKNRTSGKKRALTNRPKWQNGKEIFTVGER